MGWVYKTRTINGKRRKVKVIRKPDGRELVRVVSFSNLTDKTAKKYGRKRKKHYVNYTDKPGRASHKRKRRR